MRSSFDAPQRRPTGKDVRQGESWLSLTTIMLVFAVAACAWIATVSVYGPVFLAPFNGP